MSFEIYVGNYPREFSREDVENLFQNYEGIRLRKMFKKKNKCFSFFSCEEVHIAMSVIKEKHQSKICGRNLIVRASSDDQQNYLQLLIAHERNEKKFENVESSLISSQNAKNDTSLFLQSELFIDEYYHTVNSHDESNETDSTNILPESPFQGSIDNMLQPKKFNQNLSLCGRSKRSDTKNIFSKVSLNTMRIHTLLPANFNKNVRERCNLADMKNDFPAISLQDFNYESIYNESTDKCEASGSNTADSILPDQEIKHKISFVPREATWIEVNNFPIKTPKQVLYSLLKKYDPLEIYILSDYSKEENEMTKALACFENKSIAEFVVLAFNNFIFCRHILSVHLLEFSWISILNFPVNTTPHDLYRLTSDYNPLKIYITHNEIETEKQLTEALVCFRTKDDALNTVFNFDNTMYGGQLIMVYDIDNFQLLKEL